MSTPVLATKLFPPAKRPEVVARARLADRLDSTLRPGHRLTLVSAPPGFGKTTLLSEWARTQERVGWLSLDEGDNAPARFMAHLSAALSRIGLDLDPDALNTASPQAALIAIVNELTQRPDHALLVLDDYHVIEAPEVHEAMTFLLDHAPDHLHLLVATRTDPPFPLPRLRSRGQLTEVRAADLRFATAEAQTFLNDAMGLQLGDDDVQALDERTEGWIAGLQLAALSLRGTADRADVAEFIAAFTGSNRFVIDYLVDEVLTRQGADVRAFLLRTAVLDRLTGPLCDALTGRTDGVQALEDLDRGNVFLVPLDAERSWYRYHHLFRDVLRARLRAEAPDEVPTLHRAASAWYAAHDLVADAVRHALAAGDDDRAAYLIEEALPQVRRARQDSLLLEWIRSLPEPVVRRSPVLSILSGWSQMLAGDLDGMEHRLDDVEAALAAGAHDKALAATWADTEDLRTAPATLWVYRAALAQARGDVPATVRHARHALELAGAEDHFVRGASAGFLGLAAWAAGDVPEALATFSEAVRSLHAAGNLVDELDSTVVLGDMWISAGRPHRARRLYQKALATATGSGPPYPRATADLHVGLAELDRELNDLAGAEQHLETARVLGERGSITENRHRWYVAMAQVHTAMGEHASAKHLLDQAADLYRPGSYPDLRPIAAMRARISVAEGDLDAAAEWAGDLRAADELSYLHEYEHLTVVRLLLARGSTGALDDALALLQRLHTDAKPTRAGSLLEIGMLQALTQHARGERPEALAELNRALTTAPEPDAYVRLFLDEGASMLALLDDAGSSEYDVLRRHARRLLDKVDDRAPSESAPASAAVELPTALSERELDVLRLLASELTGPEIARHLFVSLNTLRTHTKRIFTKLDVNTRSAAVRRGRELGLL
ncbi:LuxR C-terminal-related transcriptional regulator [Kribbella sp. NPDC050820]|uniref:LuxR C-terminal-related transcriptional regulator n=1 Tax=Kribbella sp. NPDC050820 TaxID=3155408 RepID=UPI0033E23842